MRLRESESRLKSGRSCDLSVLLGFSIRSGLSPTASLSKAAARVFRMNELNMYRLFTTQRYIRSWKFLAVHWSTVHDSEAVTTTRTADTAPDGKVSLHLIQLLEEKDVPRKIGGREGPTGRDEPNEDLPAQRCISQRWSPY